ncbi:efflux RND transporter periplasmic adaptor subunit [Sphingomonas sp. RB56-2]|uniref:Efflux RND transporter periplasmic adaptor subunit n=1 Tax=Sphingomonas brevis TaxID=2908206 RepID=A0ABT0S9R3_9SPHN|nr:efflux RND transporter periplasmic adaptor subunit [Sphingomonas brevis]MCL6740870.1 efflux RND transporter periplasmic adaptor subunit [Sphingomonas brevis]
MSLVELKMASGPGAVSGGAMDRVVERKKIDKRILIGAGAGAALLLILLFWLFAPRGDSQSVNPNRLTISKVQQGTFEDFLPIRARVAPLVTVYLDAVEGGRVEQMAVEDGANVVKGQLLAVLSNADLQLSTLARQTEVEQQLNNMRSQELALQQTRSANRRELNQVQTDLSKAQRMYDLQRPLAEKGFVTGKAFNDTKDDLAFQKNRLLILKRSIAEDEQLQANQLGQLRSSTASLNQSLSIARGSLSQLQLRAPVSGQLSGFSIQLGQSLQQGERLGQIDSAGKSKLEGDVDEFYLGRVEVGQTASIEVQGKTYGLKVSKVYPQVRNGQFRIDLIFDGPEPPSTRRGQTISTKLTLGDSSRAVLIPNGAFFNDTGGNWVFVVNERGTSAERRAVQLGRRNNDFIEVLDGLKPGERVVTSSYSGLVDKDHLSFDTGE